jgi:hypothetical protein
MNNTTSANPYTEIQSFSNTALICTVVVVFLFSLVLVAILAKRSTISTSQNISQSSQSGPPISNHSPTHRETEVSRSPTLPIYRVHHFAIIILYNFTIIKSDTCLHICVETSIFSLPPQPLFSHLQVYPLNNSLLKSFK